MKSQINNLFNILIFCLILNISLQAQVAINNDANNNSSTAHPSAILDVQSTDKGILIPRMTTVQRTGINSAANGLMVFDSETASFWFYNVDTWQEIGTDNLGNHTATQNLQLGTNFLSGDGDAEGLYVNTNGNVGIGTASPDALLHVRSGVTSDSTGIKLTQDGFNSLFYHNDAGDLILRKLNRTDQLVLGFNGNIGIGTTNPQNKLHVSGNIRMEDGNQQDGFIISSDADGNFSWVDPNDVLTVPATNIPVPIKYQGTYLYVHPTENATDVDWATAQSTCDNLVAFGFDDWYLPSLSELNAMYKQSFLITGLNETDAAKYWSNTEYDVNNAYTQRLDYGGPDPDDKTKSTGHNCRCIRQNP